MTKKDYSAIAEETAKRAAQLARQINPQLAGIGPDVQGAVLLQLVSLWLAGHHPQLRGPVWEQWTQATLDLVPIQERAIFKTRPRPETWPQ